MRKITLTDEQYDLLWTDRQKESIVSKVLSGLVSQLAEQLARDDKLFWASVELLADARWCDCKIDWPNRCIVTKPAGTEWDDQ